MKTLLTVKEASPLLKMSQQAIYSAIRQRQLPDAAIVRIGHRIRLDLDALHKLADDKSDHGQRSEARDASR